MSNAFQGLFISAASDFGPDDLKVMVDGFIEEDFQWSAEATEHPVDYGTKVQHISDHIILRPMRYILTATITDTPLGLADAANALGGNLAQLSKLGAVPTTGSLLSNSSVGGSRRSVAQFDTLMKIFNGRRVFSVQTMLGLYENMAVVDIHTRKTKDTANSLDLVVTCKEIPKVTITDSSFSAAILESGNVTQQAASVVNQGVKTASSSNNQSLLQRAIGIFGG